jgi:SP family sugar:H+ symporter-like MFS transporter
VKQHFYVVVISSIAAIGGFLFGFDSGVINGTIDGLETAFGSTGLGTGWNVASMLIGCAVGALVAGQLADHLGRRGILRIAAVLFLASAWGSGWADQSLSFVVFRLLGGLAVGGASVITPAYISEVTPARYRGAMASTQQIAIISGLFLAFVSNYFLAGYAGSSTSPLWLGYEAWRWMFWIEMLPASIFGLALFAIPESPRFLVLRGQLDAADLVLNRLVGPDEASTKLPEIQDSLAGEDGPPRFSSILASDGTGMRPIVRVGIGLAVLQQFVGINVVFYYGAVLWQSVGFSEADALLTNVINGGVSIIACVLATLMIDRVGRKRLLAAGSVGMAASLSTMAISFIQAETNSGEQLVLGDISGPAALISANIYVFFFNLSWGPVMWVMLGEMFPNRIRGGALSISGLAQWTANFVITMSFPIVLVSLGLGAAYGFYAACAAFSIYFVKAHVVETMGLELEEMTE